MIEHVGVPVSNYSKGKEFYSKLLAPVGYTLYRDMPEYKAGGFLEGESTSLWIGEAEGPVTSPTHVAFGAQSKEAVQKFYEEGLKAGGKDNGAPGFRTDYGDNYYAAFIIDPDGNNMEACYFGETAPKK